jgi:hypothetical protein
MTQPAYAASHSISDRCLRAWIARFAPRCCAKPDATARLVLENAIQQCHELLRALDADPAGQPEPEPPSPVSPASAACPRVAESMPAADAVPRRMPILSPTVPVSFPNGTPEATARPDHAEEEVARRFSWI